MIFYIIFGCIMGGLLITLLVISFQNNQQQKISRNATQQGLCILLEWSIRKECRYYLQAGEVTQQQLDDLDRMWVIYHTVLKGNGYLDSLMAKVKELPIKTE